MSINQVKSSKTKGFTLVELLVVIAIIGLLASIVLTGMNNARVSARDARRKSDISQIQKALELYYNTNNSYPVSSSIAAFPYWIHSNTGDWTTLQTTMSSAIGKLPTDPRQSSSGSVYDTTTVFAYAYYSASLGGCTGGQWYILVYKLEKTPDPPSPGGFDCNTSPGYYNYTVGGNNVTLVIKATR